MIERKQGVKVLILVVGRGNRINEFSENRNKCMVSLKGQPLLKHTFLRMAEATLSELVVMFGYKAIEIINHFGIRYEQAEVCHSEGSKGPCACHRARERCF